MDWRTKGSLTVSENLPPILRKGTIKEEESYKWKDTKKNVQSQSIKPTSKTIIIIKMITK